MRTLYTPSYFAEMILLFIVSNGSFFDLVARLYKLFSKNPTNLINYMKN